MKEIDAKKLLEALVANRYNAISYYIGDMKSEPIEYLKKLLKPIIGETLLGDFFIQATAVTYNKNELIIKCKAAKINEEDKAIINNFIVELDKFEFTKDSGAKSQTLLKCRKGIKLAFSNIKAQECLTVLSNPKMETTQLESSNDIDESDVYYSLSDEEEPDIDTKSSDDAKKARGDTSTNEEGPSPSGSEKASFSRNKGDGIEEDKDKVGQNRQPVLEDNSFESETYYTGDSEGSPSEKGNKQGEGQAPSENNGSSTKGTSSKSSNDSDDTQERDEEIDNQSTNKDGQQKPKASASSSGSTEDSFSRNEYDDIEEEDIDKVRQNQKPRREDYSSRSEIGDTGDSEGESSEKENNQGEDQAPSENNGSSWFGRVWNAGSNFVASFWKKDNTQKIREEYLEKLEQKRKEGESSQGTEEDVVSQQTGEQQGIEAISESQIGKKKEPIIETGALTADVLNNTESKGQAETNGVADDIRDSKAKGDGKEEKETHENGRQDTGAATVDNGEKPEATTNGNNAGKNTEEKNKEQKEEEKIEDKLSKPAETPKSRDWLGYAAKTVFWGITVSAAGPIYHLFGAKAGSKIADFENRYGFYNISPRGGRQIGRTMSNVLPFLIGCFAWQCRTPVLAFTAAASSYLNYNEGNDKIAITWGIASSIWAVGRTVEYLFSTDDTQQATASTSSANR
jgi:hypothetical protein